MSRARRRRTIDDAAEYIAQGSFDAGVRFLVAVDRTFADLLAQPGLGRIRPFSASRASELRSWRIRGFENRLVFYRPIDGGIEVIRFLHGACDLESLFREEPE